MPDLTPQHEKQLIETVQRNCHISDARHGRDYSMCIYLLKMREYFRWEMGFGYSDPLPKNELGEWLIAREQLWGELEEEDYSELEINNREYTPFESDAINDKLKLQGLVYSGGLSTFSKPSFFLGKLIRDEETQGCRIIVAEKEVARDLNATPAMSIGNVLFIRTESLRRMIWEKIEEWQWNKKDVAMAKAIACYDFTHHFDASLDSMTENETETVILHELGEVGAGRELGESWKKMLHQLTRRRRELIARAIRDHIADCMVTLPTLLAQGADPSLHFYFANFSGMRKSIFPQLHQAYEQWRKDGTLEPLKNTVSEGADLWLERGKSLINSFEQGDDATWERIEAELLVAETKKAPAA